MRVYYNDNAARPCRTLLHRIRTGELPSGDVDERGIEAVRPDDVGGYGQCHFFAGVGGWPLALRAAGWPEDYPVWTGSCPCQPFSQAGKGLGVDDPRHVWPVWLPLIAERQPPVVFGEQIASKAGRVWLAGVRADLEALGYAFGAADLCAAGVGAPHMRQRLYWVAERVVDGSGGPQIGGIPRTNVRWVAGSSQAGGMADGEAPVGRGTAGANDPGRGLAQAGRSGWSDFDLIWCADGAYRRIEPGTLPLADGVPDRVGQIAGYGNAIVPPLAAEFVMAYMETWA